jgi:hypothetical protein
MLKDTYNDWPKFLEDPRFIRTSKEDCITWANRIPSRLANQLRASDIRRLVDERQYTFRVTMDNSIFQLYYQYDKKGKTLQAARLAFYHAQPGIPVLSTSGPMQELLNLEDCPVSWLRIDYEPMFTKGILHHDCHMHLSGFPEARCVVAGVPNPRQFVEFVMATCYPELYKEHRLDNDGTYRNIQRITDVNADCFTIESSLAYQQLTHLRIPTS